MNTNKLWLIGLIAIFIVLIYIGCFPIQFDIVYQGNELLIALQRYGTIIFAIILLITVINHWNKLPEIGMYP